MWRWFTEGRRCRRGRYERPGRVGEVTVLRRVVALACPCSTPASTRSWTASSSSRAARASRSSTWQGGVVATRALTILLPSSSSFSSLFPSLWRTQEPKGENPQLRVGLQ
jgi:hypothetical protein